MITLLNYPRPDFRRKIFVDLCGRWLFFFDDEERYDLVDEIFDLFDLEIEVPFPYQSELSGIGSEEEHNVVWYLKRFKVGSSDLDRFKVFLLNFGAVDYYTKVWVNGNFVGEHVGGYTPFKFDISRFLIEGENELVLRVEDRHRDQPRGKQAESGKEPRGIIYTRVTGIWQPVWLEYIRGDMYIDRVLVKPGLDGRVSLSVALGGRIVDNAKLRIDVEFLGSDVASKKVRVDGDEVRVSFDLDEVYTWSPEEPYLYDLKVSLTKGDVLDSVETYFGIRSIESKGGKVLLNGRPVFLKMVLDQGYYYEGIYTPPTPARFLDDLRCLKEMGFNGIRAHQKPPDPRYLYIADCLGLLIWDEMADWGMSLKPENLDVFWSQWRDVVLRDYNHPSVIAWVPFNERAEAGRSRDAREFIREIYVRTKKLDDSRFVVDNSGFTHVVTDILDVHDYVYSLETGKTYLKLLLEKSFWEPILSGSVPISDFGLKISVEGAYHGQPVVISEFGGWGIEGQKPIIDRDKWVYRSVRDSFELEMKYRDAVLAMARCGRVSGFCYTQFYDVEGELNGLLTYDRIPKVRFECIREANKEAERLYFSSVK